MMIHIYRELLLVLHKAGNGVPDFNRHPTGQPHLATASSEHMTIIYPILPILLPDASVEERETRLNHQQCG